MEYNPICIESSPSEDSSSATPSSATPLVLIHDGGGTIFPYIRLGSLNCDVWLCEGGLDAMAGIYVDLIKNAGIRGPVLLGGWFSIAGLLLIDSPLHIPMCKLPPAGLDPGFGELPELIDFAMSLYCVGTTAIQTLSKLS
ncbi:putative polyketide synthase PksR [Calycina marina]|uniref:Polyketide synthase PksR n=1 Tax=Calycina marina TaxID=1763456 RepID=A0A9P8CBK6_9HELO|nr:putative polyketide synthase PksR [Calycina marina]